ncbi:hypothetical protein Hanom_Chr02g00152571 [Helianthus anomalus]
MDKDCTGESEASGLSPELSPETIKSSERVPKCSMSPGDCQRSPNLESFNDGINGEAITKIVGDQSNLQFQNVEGIIRNSEGNPEVITENEFSTAKSLKRKKIKNFVHMGLINSGGSSSVNQRPTREPKQMENDIFGLDPIIWTMGDKAGRCVDPGPIITENNFSVLGEYVVVEACDAETKEKVGNQTERTFKGDSENYEGSKEGEDAVLGLGTYLIVCLWIMKCLLQLCWVGSWVSNSITFRI